MTGETAERFIAMAEANKGEKNTFIPQSMRQSILQMNERSRNFQIKKPR